MLECVMSGGLGFAVLAASMSVINRMGSRTAVHLRLAHILLCVSGFLAFLHALDPTQDTMLWSWSLGSVGVLSMMSKSSRYKGVDDDSDPESH